MRQAGVEELNRLENFGEDTRKFALIYCLCDRTYFNIRVFLSQMMHTQSISQSKTRSAVFFLKVKKSILVQPLMLYPDDTKMTGSDYIIFLSIKMIPVSD